MKILYHVSFVALFVISISCNAQHLDEIGKANPVTVTGGVSRNQVFFIPWPLPEKVEWNYPTEMTLLQDQGDLFYGQFKDAGIYEMSLAAHLGECFDQMTKSILVPDEGSSSECGRLGYEEYVKQFRLYPNPNNGAFHVGIELTEEMPITVSIWHAPSGILIR
ncbi:MAG TPA: hypothetical protein VIM65_03275 [Cyclobacteriaceae bacterium]